MFNIGLIGLGTVGSGVYEIVNSRKKEIEKLSGKKVEIKKILVKNLDKERDVDVDKGLLTNDPNEIFNDPEINIVAEAISEKESAYLYMKTALENKKHVVTANKAVVACKIDELLKLAEENERAFLFEASVGGGVPIIKPLKESVNIDNIMEIQGILNGTTNYILTQMFDKDLDFNVALKDAQDLGYAELDPTDDIEGYDSLRKISILSTIGFKRKVDINDVKCQGISGISFDDIQMFKKLNYVPKLLGSSQLTDDGLNISVEPVLVRKNNLFSNVKDALNIISIKGNVMGELQFYGEGAGKNPTGCAMFSDILDIINDSYDNNKIYIDETKKEKFKLFSGKYYLRVNVEEDDDIVNILNILNRNRFKYEVVSNNKNLFITTDDVDGEIISDVVACISRDLNKEYFCSRIDDAQH